nr:MAG TPA: hypothetical protein [Caudoviricetes sp.]
MFLNNPQRNFFFKKDVQRLFLMEVDFFKKSKC